MAKPKNDKMDLRINSESDDKLDNIKIKIDDTKQIMQKNVENIIERGNALEITLDKAIVLEENANIFKRKSTNLKHKYCRDNAKMIAAVSFIIVLIIVVIGLIIYNNSS